jgi:anthranilate phosphoribosyltransferase
VHTYTVHPDDFALPSNCPEELHGGDAARNADLTLRLLRGEALPQRGIVLLNAAAAIAAGTPDRSIADCLPLAQEALDSGQALAKLEHLREFTRQWSQTS